MRNLRIHHQVRGGPDLARLKTIACVTEQRGTHAFGLAWLTASGRLEMFKRPGAASARLSDLDRCRDAVAVIGHCRFATHGNAPPPPRRNGQRYVNRASIGPANASSPVPASFVPWTPVAAERWIA